MPGGPLSWLRRTVGGLFGRAEDLRTPGALAGLPRILLLGPTGAGKSTLVNAMLGIEAAETRAGAPVTAETTWHAGPRWPVALGDTRGLEAAEGETQASRLGEALDALRPHERPHLAWLVLNAEAGRAHAGAGTLSALAGTLRDRAIPALIVLTHAEPGDAPAARLRARIAATMGDAPMVTVNTEPLRAPDGTILIPRHGLDTLRRATEDRLPGAAR